MPNAILLREAELLLSCPDDGASVRLCGDAFLCAKCARRFSVLAGVVVDMLPHKPSDLPGSSVSEPYRRGYLEEFHRQLCLEESRAPWGDPTATSAKWAAVQQRQAEEAILLLLRRSDGQNKILCDISVGAGYCRLAFARHFRLVLHCDLSVDSIGFAWRRARELRQNNLLFLRMDYFRPPFRGVVDRLVCLDTLIRGEEHERMLLALIGRSLVSDWIAVIDFHHWWHNPLRRIGILRDNFKGNRSCTRSSLRCFLEHAGIGQFERLRFVPEAHPSTPLGKLVARMIPATRFIYRMPAWEQDGRLARR